MEAAGLLGLIQINEKLRKAYHEPPPSLAGNAFGCVQPPNRPWFGFDERSYVSRLDGLVVRRGASALARLGCSLAANLAIDFDGAFEVRAIFDHDARGGQLAEDRTIFFDLDAVASTQIALDLAVDEDLGGQDVGGDLGAGADGEFATFHLDQSVDGAVHEEVLVSGDLAFDEQICTQAGT